LTRQRLNAREAAEVLNISVDAVRMRVRRGTLEAEHDANGRLYVWLDTDEPQPDSSALISEMRAHNETLRQQLEAERQAHAEARRLLMAALERIPPQLESAAPEARESPVSPGPGDRPPDTTDADRSPQVAADERQVAALQRRWDDTPDAGGGPQTPSERQQERRWWEFWR
jgi:hypothetical protein